MEDSSRLSIFEVEAYVLTGDLDCARANLRVWIANQIDEEIEGRSVCDLIRLTAQSPGMHPSIAAYVLRCVAVDGLLPDNNGRNNVPRLVSDLCEKSLPRLCDRLKLSDCSQTYQKFEKLSGTPTWLADRLEPLTQPYHDLEALLKGRRDISGVLKDKAVQECLRPYDVPALRGHLDELFFELEQVNRYDESISDAVERCDACLDEIREASKSRRSYFTAQFLDPLIERIQEVRDSFLQTMKAEFAATIVRSSSSNELPKRYPLHDEGREIRVAIPLKNLGPGPATKTKVTVSHADSQLAIDGLTKNIGTLPKGSFSVTIDALIVTPSENADLIVDVEWTELGAGHSQTESFDFSIRAQRSDIDWDLIEFKQPYRTDVAEGDRFIGRTEKVRAVGSQLLSDPMTPFYITGQKRVGKTSLIKAVTAFAEQRASEHKIASHYILWGNVAHVDPTESMRQFGQSLEDFILDNSAGRVPEQGDYSGSLSHIVKLLKHAQHTNPETKLVCIIDEFDEIHEELFLSGNLASTFFANLRAISREPNFCLCLVGGENMPFLMERQGQKLNNFARIDLNYYSRDTEWVDFEQLVSRPTDGLLSWHEEAISRVFNETNGNPYFANLICAGVYKSAVSDRDSDITEVEVEHAINREISALGANSFAHLWQDGIPKPSEEREPDILRRTRVLVALARCLIADQPPTPTNISDHRASVALSESEITPVLHDLLRRNVLSERGGQYRPCLPLFTRWLRDAGVTHLVADHLSDEIAGSVVERENAARVQSREIVELVESWPTYLGRKLGVDDVKSWLEQVESAFDQRLLFKLLKRTRVFSEAHVRERLGNLHKRVQRDLPVPIRKSKRERRRDIVVTYVDGPAKSGASYAALYAEENLIDSSLVFERNDFPSAFAKHKKDHEVNAIVVVDDIIGTGKSMTDNLKALVSQCGESLEGTKIRVLSLTATPEGHRYVDRHLSQLDGAEVDLYVEEILAPELFAFPESGDGWEGREEKERAESLCRDLGSYIYKKSPFGYGGMGLLVVFPTTVPNNALPILHSKSKRPKEQDWKPLFVRPVN